MAVIIRKYKSEDRESCRKICIETAAPDRVKTEKQRQSLVTVYSDSYVDFEKNICFVAEEDGHVVGYILCAPDTQAYCKNAMRHHIRPMLKTDPVTALLTMGEFAAYRFLAKRRSAHMHIDILPSHQRMGIGTRFVNALLEELRTQSVNGLFLITDTGNKKGPRFYEKYGFNLSYKVFFALVYTIDFK